MLPPRPGEDRLWVGEFCCSDVIGRLVGSGRGSWWRLRPFDTFDELSAGGAQDDVVGRLVLDALGNPSTGSGAGRDEGDHYGQHVVNREFQEVRRSGKGVFLAVILRPRLALLADVPLFPIFIGTGCLRMAFRLIRAQSL